MINFTISFLISFPITPKALSIIDEKRTTSKISSVDRKTKPKSEREDGSPTFIELNTSNIANAVHITYELLQNRCKYEIDVLCWGPIVKILSKDGQANMYTIIKNKVIWVPVVVEHRIESLTIPEIKAFRERIIEFTVSNNVTKVNSVLKNEKVVVHQDSIIQDDEFIENTKFSLFCDKYGVSDTKSMILKTGKMSTKSMITRRASIQKTEYSWLHLDNDFDTFYEIIEKISNDKMVITNECIPPCESKRKDDIIPRTSRSKVSLPKNMYRLSKDQVDKKERNGDKLNSFSVLIPAEIFFTKPTHSVFHKECNSVEFIKNFFVFPSVSQLMLRGQKLSLNPLVINITKINNFPAEELIEKGFKSVFAYYNIPEVLDCKTQTKLIEKTILFNNSHMYFTDEVQKIKVIEALQTQKFFVELYGNKELKEATPICNFFGRNPEDFNISKIKPTFENTCPEEDDKPVLLAVSLFDLSSLVENIWTFREKGQCHQPFLTLTSKPEYDKAKTQYTVNEINLEYKKPKVIIPECTYIELGTTLTLEAFLMAPQAPSLDYHYAPNTFKRIFLIADEENFAKILYNSVETNNNAILETPENSIKNSQDLEYHDILTGFILDNGSSHFFYMEGPSSGFILNIWHIIQGACPVPEESLFSINDDEKLVIKNGKIFFNTDNTFEKRLYKNFTKFGMYKIVLKIPLQDILAKPLLYVRKNVPKPCMEALNKLCLLFHSTNYKDILQQNLLPTAQELSSLNIEWGVPDRWKGK